MNRLRRYLALIGFVTILTFCFNIILNKYDSGRMFVHKVIEEKVDRFLISTAGCQIPKYDPFDDTVSHLYRALGNLTCPGPKSLVSYNRSHLILDVDEVERQFGEISCLYRAINRVDNGKSDDRYDFSVAKELLNAVKIMDNFIQIDCKNTLGDIVYTELLPFIQIKPELETKCEERFKNWINLTNDINERLDVTLVGIDSVSRLNMLRHMPRTYNYLVNEMNAIDLQGFVKLADNTFVNVVPLLAGTFVEESWNESMVHESFDYMNIIWKNFSQKGYRTLYGEDCSELSAFNYLKAGFWKQPTDYYLRPFGLAMTDSNILSKNKNCYNSRPESEVTLHWLLDFLITFKDKPNFSFLYNTRLTHDELNYVGYADEIYYKFLQQYTNHNLNQNTILILFSDHGIRYGPIRNTYVGKIEERMPFVFLVFPPWFRTKYPNLWQNLKTNQHRLTTFFDLHETLKQVLHFTGQEIKSTVNNRGISLFSEIPSERTCEDAAILPHWCTCHEKKEVALDNDRVLISAGIILDEINKLLSSVVDKCAVLTLERIVDARASVLSDEILKFQDSKNDVIDRKVIYGERLAGVWEYLLTISVNPGSGLFEATVKYYEKSGKFEMSGDISRINLYGNSSHCVDSPKLKIICYCAK